MFHGISRLGSSWSIVQFCCCGCYCCSSSLFNVGSRFTLERRQVHSSTSAGARLSVGQVHSDVLAVSLFWHAQVHSWASAKVRWSTCWQLHSWASADSPFDTRKFTLERRPRFADQRWQIHSWASADSLFDTRKFTLERPPGPLLSVGRSLIFFSLLFFFALNSFT